MRQRTDNRALQRCKATRLLIPLSIFFVFLKKQCLTSRNHFSTRQARFYLSLLPYGIYQLNEFAVSAT